MPITETNRNIAAIDVEAVNSKENRALYAARQKVHPKRVTGFFRNLKWLIMGITLGIYYLTPWLRWDRGAHAPDQAVLVDLANRRFYFFFIEIWPQEFFFVAGLLVMAGIGLFLVTSTVGRAWCGYTCPQTVWVDLFLVVERAIEGDRNARIKLDKAAWSGEKIRKRLTKHIIWLAISVFTGGAWIFYFADAPTLARDLLTGQAVFVAYSTVAVLTATTYIFGGLMREQVCTYMCPWPRIQAAMLDEDSLTVTYNDWRGEPRARHTKKARASGAPVGDCVDCNACVAVCPMGIDIRDGQQMECITCALCIDACNNVMQKVGLDDGLISYTTLRDYRKNSEIASASRRLVQNSPPSRMEQTGAEHGGERPPHHKVVATSLRSVFRPRTLAYGAIWSAVGVALIVALLMRDRLDLTVRHDRNPVFVKLSDGSIRNGYEIKILNMLPKLRGFTLSIDKLPGAFMKIAGTDTRPLKQIAVVVAPDQLRSIKVFVRLPLDEITSTRQDFEFVLKEIDGEESKRETAHFDAPEIKQ